VEALIKGKNSNLEKEEKQEIKDVSLHGMQFRANKNQSKAILF